MKDKIVIKCFNFKTNAPQNDCYTCFIHLFTSGLEPVRTSNTKH